jgi:hypothetical protein
MSILAKGNISKVEKSTSRDDENWFNDIKETILYNDNVGKPSIAKLTFDTTYRPVKWGSNDEDLPYKWFDDSYHELSPEEAYWKPDNIRIDDHGYDNNEHVIEGQIATGDEMEQAKEANAIVKSINDTQFCNEIHGCLHWTL